MSVLPQPSAVDPQGSTWPWQCYQQLRSICHPIPPKVAGLLRGDRRLSDLSIPEVAPLRRTLKAWRQQVLPYFDTSRVSNSVTEVINLITEKVRGSPTDSKTLIITDSGSRSPHPATAHTADNHDCWRPAGAAATAVPDLAN